jgi:hypothetical protein
MGMTKDIYIRCPTYMYSILYYRLNTMNKYGTTSVVLSVTSVVVVVYAWLRVDLRGCTAKERKMAVLHLFAGVCHVVSALALGWIAESEPVVWEAPTYTLISVWQNTTSGGCSEDGRCYVGTRLEWSGKVSVAVLAVLFGIISGYAHICGAVYVGPAKLTEYAESGSNWTRWADYGLSASLMVVVIGCLSGVVDSYVLITIGLFQAFLLSSAYFVEKDLASAYVEDTDTWSRGIAGLVLACAFYVPGVWAPILGSFYASIQNAPSDVPEWVNAMIWILFVLFSSFVGNMVWYLVFTGDNGLATTAEKKRRMVSQELGYVCLSLTSKITLHWVLFSGIMSRSGVLFASEAEATDPALYHRSGEDGRKTTERVLIAAASSITFGLLFYMVFRVYILREYAAGTYRAVRYYAPTA